MCGRTGVVIQRKQGRNTSTKRPLTQNANPTESHRSHKAVASDAITRNEVLQSSVPNAVKRWVLAKVTYVQESGCARTKRSGSSLEPPQRVRKGRQRRIRCERGFLASSSREKATIRRCGVPRLRAETFVRLFSIRSLWREWLGLMASSHSAEVLGTCSMSQVVTLFQGSDPTCSPEHENHSGGAQLLSSSLIHIMTLR
jgi:hypothetical protein